IMLARSGKNRLFDPLEDDLAIDVLIPMDRIYDSQDFNTVHWTSPFSSKHRDGHPPQELRRASDLLARRSRLSLAAPRMVRYHSSAALFPRVIARPPSIQTRPPGV